MKLKDIKDKNGKGLLPKKMPNEYDKNFLIDDLGNKELVVDVEKVYEPECSSKLTERCKCEYPVEDMGSRIHPNYCKYCHKIIPEPPKPPKKIEKLVDLNRNIIEIQDNEALFDLILEQRFKINEIIDKGRES